MDLSNSCKDKLAYFKIKELKDVLTQLGLPKQGKKQELVDRILLLLSDEQDSKSKAWAKKIPIGKTGVAKIIDDTYRKMHTPKDANHLNPKEAFDSYKLDIKVRCPCGSSLCTDSMIQCEDPRCQVWQHIKCVIVPEKPMEGVLPELPRHFYCEICRLSRADPFWLSVDHPLLPNILVSSNFAPSYGSNTTTQSIEKTYLLSKADKDMLQRIEYDLQVWCILLNDKVPFRMQWPEHPDLQVNGIPVRVTNRPGDQLLGINGRDDGQLITTCSEEGINKLCFSRCDNRTFCIGVRIAERHTVQQVLSMIPKEADGEHFEEALASVRHCVGGGNATDNAYSDSDIEVVADSISVNLRCPMSGSRIKIAGRFMPCTHMRCFDLETFVELNKLSRKWQCPICLENYSLEKIIIDPYFNRITSMMKNCGEDVNEIEVKPDGSWRVKNESGNKDLSRWHLPDGSLSTATEAEAKQGLNSSKLTKQEDTSGWHTSLKLGMRKNHVQERNENQLQNRVPSSSSDDQSTFNADADVIVLTDSEDEDNMIMAPSSNPNDISYPSHGYSNNNKNGDSVVPQCEVPTYLQTGFQLFGTDANVPDALVDMSPVAGCDSAPIGGMWEISGQQNLAACPDSEENGCLIDNPLAYGIYDPSLQISFPSRSSENPQSGLNDRNQIAGGGDKASID